MRRRDRGKDSRQSSNSLEVVIGGAPGLFHLGIDFSRWQMVQLTPTPGHDVTVDVTFEVVSLRKITSEPADG